MAIARPAPSGRGPAGGWRGLLARIPYKRELLLGFLFLCALLLGTAWGTWRNLCAGDACPSIAQVQTFEHEQTTKVLAADGRLITEFGFERRTPISIHALPEYVPQAVIAVEDKRFYRHHGFDPWSIARAVYGVLTFQSGRFGGGSTITQQFARNMFDQIGFDREGLGLYLRKFREIQVAIDLERSYTKDQILEAYLNEIYMGRVGYGFQNAARAYLGKNLTDVNVAEAALLAAILNSPGTYDPFRYPERAEARRNLVLRRMAEQGFLTQEESERWQRFPLPEAEGQGPVTSVAPYFEEWVRQILDSRFGDAIYSNGYRVYTTLDVDMQRIAEEVMREGWETVEADTANFKHAAYAEFDTVRSFPGSQTPYLQGAFIALDPYTGHVKALVGGRDFAQSEFDRARLARRQPGSGFKPFVYAAAIASGIPASYVIDDGPVVLPQIGEDDWRPANFSNEFLGPITIREALYRSINMVAIKLGWFEVGIETVAQTARRMGIQTPIARVPSTTIGASEVIPIEIAEAYSAFPTMGWKVTPMPILRVENAEGEVIWEPQPERIQVLDSLTASIMVSMLQDVVTRGTAASAVRVNAGLPAEVPAAGKTGTTNDGTDVWFNGFTPNLLATVWFGMDNPAPIWGPGAPRGTATGSAIAAPVWGNFMRRVYYGVEGDEERGIEPQPPLLDIPEPWTPHPGLNALLVDRKTGLLASRWCPEEDQYIEYYIPGTEPTELCDRSDRRFRIPLLR
ncbi:MAG TPA: PBP1A family penicillin-binding protein [Longimicrobiales bacterium]|nr:PBP1A family penicillin-binding protein [Longimicrobiales bacterium]